MVPWDRRGEGKDSGTIGVPVEGTEGRPMGFLWSHGAEEGKEKTVGL